MNYRLLKKVFSIVLLINGPLASCDETFIGKVLSAIGSVLTGPKKAREGTPEDPSDPTLTMTTPEFIRHEGYPAESHTVLTMDGYFITMHRIPGHPGAPPVFLQHGVIASSFDWVVAGKGKSFAFILADLGYDVWIGNARGNTYCKNHTTYSTNDARFWDFSWHEMGVYDLPAEISHVTRVSGQKVIYVGHSMGSTMFYVMAIEKPEVASEIKAAFCLSPVAFVNDIKSPMKMFAPLSYEFERISDIFGNGEFMPDDSFMKVVTEIECKAERNERAICSNMLFFLFGYDEPQFNYTLFPRFSSHTPAGTSARTIAHYAQEVRSGKFQHYIRGPHDEEASPIYDLKKIDVPVGLFWSENDWLADPKNVQELWSLLPNRLVNYKIPNENFNHMDFLLGIDAPSLVYEPLLAEMKKIQ